MTSPDGDRAVVPTADVPLAAVDLLERIGAHGRAARGAFADNTVRALAADSGVFAAWCLANGRAALPASPETVAGFVDAMAASNSRATVERYRSSIAALHRAAGVPNLHGQRLLLCTLDYLERTNLIVVSGSCVGELRRLGKPSKVCEP